MCLLLFYYLCNNTLENIEYAAITRSLFTKTDITRPRTQTNMLSYGQDTRNLYSIAILGVYGRNLEFFFLFLDITIQYRSGIFSCRQWGLGRHQRILNISFKPDTPLLHNQHVIT